MMDMYKVRTNWSNYADRIRSISDYPASAVAEAVDLGLSVKWASLNVGAWGCWDYGDYYAWGEIEPYYCSLDPLTWKEGDAAYSWSSYKWCNGANKLTKYCLSGMTSYWDGVGEPDGKTVLDLDDDAARVNWGKTWRMPTSEEWRELRTNCTWTKATQHGIRGMLVTASNGNSIFLPAGGYYQDRYLMCSGWSGEYWSSSLSTTNPIYAGYGHFLISGAYNYANSRYLGRAIRPVCE